MSTGIYVHVPFCITRCGYCDFNAYAGLDHLASRYVTALFREAELAAPAWADDEVASVFLGGGTPTTLEVADLKSLLVRLRASYAVTTDAEVTIEANPGPDERGDAVALRDAGINRISYGGQSLDANELRRLGRRHGPDDVAAAVAEARQAGIGSINVDLLYDVPGGTLGSWMSTLEEAMAVGPDHLSLYALTLDDPDAEGLTGPGGDHLPTTSGARRWRDAARADQDEDRATAQYHHAVHALSAAGWRGYEISNWARPSHESRHNLAYWERRPYEGVGPGAHAFDGASRRWNAARLDGYLSSLDPPAGESPRLPPGGSELLDEATAAAERVILGLRTDRGLPINDADREPLAGSFDWALAFELVEVTGDGRIVLTTRGRLLSNELFARLV